MSALSAFSAPRSFAPADTAGAIKAMLPAGHLPSWPMAFFLIGAGVPQRSAWTAAEANAGLIEATRRTAAATEAAFSTYRSEGGHATAQIIMPRAKLPEAGDNPIAQMMRSWLDLWTPVAGRH